MADAEKPKKKRGFFRRNRAIVQSVLDTTAAYTKVVVPKTADENAFIFKAFADKPLFSKLDDLQLNEVASIMTREKFKKGEQLMTEGKQGDTFFILSKGSTACSMGSRFVRELNAGDGFGEIALIYNQPRTATITAQTPCEVFKLDRAGYRNVVVESIKAQRVAQEAFLKEVPLFAKMTPADRAKVADALHPQTFEPGKRIITQGEMGELFYIIADGTVEITEDSTDKKLHMSKGKFFGEIALLKNVPRTANVTAQSEVKVYSLDRASFGRLFGAKVVAMMSEEAVYELPTAAGTMTETVLEEHRPLMFESPKVEDFLLGTHVGFGAFGFVRIAKHKKTDQIVALKGMSKAYLISKNQGRHAINERNLLRECNHPGIVKLYGSFQDDTLLYICLEFLNGGELFTLLGQKGRLSNDATRALGAEIVMMFDYMHTKEIIYRDLKPENVMLDDKGHVRLIDFGLAKKVHDRTWTMCGTPEYLAPEVVQNRGHNKSADYWTLGVLIYEMLVGVPPFYDETATDDETFNRILREKPRFPSFVGANAKDIVLKLMEHDVTRRLGCMADGCDGLRAHYWFKGIDWTSVGNQTQEMPFVPRLSGPDDLRHFEIDEADILARKRLFDSVAGDEKKNKIFDEF